MRGLSGIVASSPLVLQTFPAPKALRFVGGKASALFPALLIDAPIPVDVSVPPWSYPYVYAHWDVFSALLRPCCCAARVLRPLYRGLRVQDLSHDKAANDANRTDPLVIQKGSLKGLNDMLSGVRLVIVSPSPSLMRVLLHTRASNCSATTTSSGARASP